MPNVSVYGPDHHVQGQRLDVGRCHLIFLHLVVGVSGSVWWFKDGNWCLSSGAFFFSNSVELITKGAGGGGAGREIMDSNTSLPWILTPSHFLAVSAICFERSDLA